MGRFDGALFCDVRQRSAFLFLKIRRVKESSPPATPPAILPTGMMIVFDNH
jgi:hypothetical protein